MCKIAVSWIVRFAQKRAWKCSDQRSKIDALSVSLMFVSYVCQGLLYYTYFIIHCLLFRAKAVADFLLGQVSTVLLTVQVAFRISSTHINQAWLLLIAISYVCQGLLYYTYFIIHCLLFRVKAVADFRNSSRTDLVALCKFKADTVPDKY